MALSLREADVELQKALRQAVSEGKLPLGTQIEICSRTPKRGKQTIYFARNAKTKRRLRRLGTVVALRTICG